MNYRLARPLAIAVVITIGGGLMLRSCARQMERRIAVPGRGSPADTQSGPPDSARAVALALMAYRADHDARGESPPLAHVTSFVADSAGFRLELAPQAGPGVRATVRVDSAGFVELRRLAP